MDDNVIHKCTLRIKQGRVLRLPNRQPGSVIHGNVLNSCQRLRTSQAYVTHVADIEDADPGAHCHMLGDDAAAQRCGVFDRHVPAIEFHHLRTHLAMDGVQRSFADGGRLNRRQDNLETSSGWLPDGVTDYRNMQFFRGSNEGELCVSALLTESAPSR
jgi:hypothetical protein